ncbi:MAG: PAS domain-containing protein [Candidatus Glassbacteria bacterium]|nr:PAS domain-containing protein [Candidatus Glassbacteria bacterium]
MAVKQNSATEVILGSIAEGVFTVDDQWVITSFNRAATIITGFSSDEVIGSPCKNIFRSNLCQVVCPLAQALRTGRKVLDRELQILRKDETVLDVRVNAAVLYDEQGTPIGGVETFRDISQIKTLTEELTGRYEFRNIIGKSKRMQEIYQLIDDITDSDSTVLIEGKSGTGKELIANAIHYHSRRKKNPFVKINCSAFSESLLESELFGHVRGAFTGAVKDKPGRFELADKGTIFLDEIGEASPNTQVKFLRVLQERQFERVGGTRAIQVDLRVIAATNKDLKQEVEKGNFRDDLYYRLNIIPIKLPPLTKRKEDIPLLIEHFISKYNMIMNKTITGTSGSALDLLETYNYPGNIRELENAVEYAFNRCRGKIIKPEMLPVDFRRAVIPQTEDSREESERARILKALETSKWNKNRAAKHLNMSRTTLWRKMKKYNVSYET